MSIAEGVIMNRSEEERHHHIHEITFKLKTLGFPYYLYSLEQVILDLFKFQEAK